MKKSDSILENAISMDQIIGRAWEKETQLSSLQMTADENSLLGSCDLGYSCAYSSTVSWLTPTLPLMAENNPRVLFERMFGASDSTGSPLSAPRASSRIVASSTLLTIGLVNSSASLEPGDKRKVNDYLAALRDVERRIQKAEEQSYANRNFLNWHSLP